MPTASGRLPGGPGRGCGHTEETRPLELRGPHGRTPRPTIDMVSLTVGEKSQPGDGRGQAGCPSLQWPETLSSPFRQGLPKQVWQLWWVGWGVSGPGRGCPAALQPSAGRPHRHGGAWQPTPTFLQGPGASARGCRPRNLAYISVPRSRVRVLLQTWPFRSSP